MIASLSPIDAVIKHFDDVDPVIAKVLPQINWSEWFEDRSTSDHFYNLTRNIIYQQLAGKAASTIFGRFENLVKEVTSQNVIAIEDQQLRDAGLSWAKVKYIKDLADKVIKAEINLTKLDSMANEEVITELTKVKGIGRWTAEMFLLFTLHREDIFSYGDLGLKNGLAKLYKINEPKPQQITKIVERWSPYESYASIALWHTLDNR
ncbi:DNA-3-methyladenine glycosylase 2 family protein [Candidatus Woesebacteria bacterium]|nr:DNA-3-methyladenine glycosylase 2 family protein [Candidatus Woesebacteria bacterium]